MFVNRCSVHVQMLKERRGWAERSTLLACSVQLSNSVTSPTAISTCRTSLGGNDPSPVRSTRRISKRRFAMVCSRDGHWWVGRPFHARRICEK